MGKSVDELERIYMEEGEHIFDKRNTITKVLSGIRNNYHHRKLTARLKEEFTDKSILEQRASNRTQNASKGAHSRCSFRFNVISTRSNSSRKKVSTFDFLVIAGLDPAIQTLILLGFLDTRVKPEHDDPLCG